MNYFKTDKETKELIAALKERAKRVRTDKKFARQVLFDAGIITEKGNLRKPYRHLCIKVPQV